jgi:DNA-binding MarR family transcriptional regulator
MYRGRVATEERADRSTVADSLLASARALVGMAVRTVDEGPMPVTLAQHRVLLLLEETGGLSVNDVAARLGVNQSNASRHCTRLDELGLVDRSQAPHDRRSVELHLTAAGRRQVLAVRDARRAWVAAVLGRMPARQAADVVRALSAFATASQEHGGDEPAPLL